MVPLTLLMPSFMGTGLQVRWHQYNLRAMALHRGSRQDCGHFRPCSCKVLIADDNRHPARSECGKREQQDAYLIWLTPTRTDDQSSRDTPTPSDLVILVSMHRRFSKC